MYNVHGLQTFIDLTSDDLEVLLLSDIIILVETWAAEENNFRVQRLTQLTPNYQLHFIPAIISESEQERACGGIMLLLKKGFYRVNNIFTQTRWYINAVVENIEKQQMWLLTAVYLNNAFTPSDLEQFKLDINELQDLFPAELHILTGDLNARIGLLNSIEEEEVLPSTKWAAKRRSMDTETNNRGEKLHEFFETAGYMVLNGRSSSDEEGQFTFISQSTQSETKSGGSVIDLCYVNINNSDQVEDFKVLEVAASDHFPICITMATAVKMRPRQVGTRLKWNPELEEAYQRKIKVSVQEDSSAQGLAEIISSVATELKMITKGLTPGYKAWFDAECRDTRKLLRRLQRQAKQANGLAS